MTNTRLSRRDFARLSMLALGSSLVGPSWATSKAEPQMPQINGTVAPGFERVRDAFAANFEKHGDVGAACSVYHRGKKVVDLWGGLADVDSGRPWEEDSLVLVFSSTKGATAICAHLLAQRGELDLDAPVAQYWPEFAAAGKKDIPVRWLLSHRVGLPVFDRPLTVEEYLSWDTAVSLLAAQRPMWEPGSTFGYHAGTYGWLVGEVVRRISGKSLGTFFADEVAKPLGLEFWIGLPEDKEDRVVPMRSIELDDAGVDAQATTPRRRLLLDAARDEDSYLSRPTTTEPLDMNTRAFHATEMPAGNGITDARSLARMYASLVGDGVDGVRLLNDKTIETATTEQSSGRDEVLWVDNRFALGFTLNSEDGNLGQEGAFGHSGAGGSLGFADPKAEIGFGYVMNQMQLVATDDPRTLSLVAAIHESLKA
jgi:CubicO group peptidase (beta-lactamase class C family)